MARQGYAFEGGGGEMDEEMDEEMTERFASAAEQNARLKAILANITAASVD